MKIKHILLSMAAAVSFAMPAFAAPVLFNIDTISLTPGLGYGVNSEDLLDVSFTNPVAPGSFFLDTATPATAFKTFKVSAVSLNEVCINPGGCTGDGNETKLLNVDVSFHFLSPVTGDKLVTMTGTATPGDVVDGKNEKVDYTLTFGFNDYDFGTGGKFRLDLADLTYSTNGSQDLMATITLLQAPAPAAVPEPASLALMGLGLAGLAARRKRNKA